MATKKTSTRAKKAAAKKPARAKTAGNAQTKTAKQSRGNCKLSGLDAAAQILAKAKEPMGCKDIVEQTIGKELWSPGGKTPQATLYAAIIREIAKKGKDARFKKIARGRFQLAR